MVTFSEITTPLLSVTSFLNDPFKNTIKKLLLKELGLKKLASFKYHPIARHI